MKITNIKPTARDDTKRFAVVFENGWWITGFRWTRGGQLTGPLVKMGRAWQAIAGTTQSQWYLLRELCLNDRELNSWPTEGWSNRNSVQQAEQPIDTSNGGDNMAAENERGA